MEASASITLLGPKVVDLVVEFWNNLFWIRKIGRITKAFESAYFNKGRFISNHNPWLDCIKFHPILFKIQQDIAKQQEIFNSTSQKGK